ncbi:MAG: SdrD B-like domain-containing protein, partial [Phycisphaeraceae bacterium JB051]
TVMVQQPVTGGTVNLSDADQGLLYGAVFTGSDGGYSGRMIASAGDVNGDGINDFLIGDYSDDTIDNYNGSVYLIYGRATGFAGNIDIALVGTDALPGAVFRGNEYGMSAGYSVAAAGDVDHDGYDDFLIGAPYADAADSLSDNSGAVFLIYGDASLTGEYQLEDVSSGNLDGAVFNGLYSGNYLGRNITSAGDVNGDGFDDLLIGNPNAGHVYGDYGSAGEAYVIYGGANRLAGEYNVSEVGESHLPGATFLGVGNYYPSYGSPSTIYDSTDYHVMEQVGYSVSSAGDFNGDGFDDILLGTAPTGVSKGRAYLIYGSADGLDGSHSVMDVYNEELAGVVFIESLTSHIGSRVASAGDVNGDGYDDLLISDQYGGSVEAGTVYLIYGRAETLSGYTRVDQAHLTGKTRFYGSNSYGYLGSRIASAGDINGDGYDDLLINAPAGESYSASGPRTYLVYGDAQQLPSVYIDDAIDDGRLRGIILEAAYASHQIVALGDVNGDGFDDFMSGLTGPDNQSNDDALKAYLLYGSASGQISGTAWKDANNNGIQDPDESTLAEILVTLLDEQGNTLAQTYTDAQGQYDFSLLSVGDYQVRFATPWSYQFTDANQGQDDSVDSDADVSTGYTHWINLDYGQDVQNIDAGYQRIADPLIANALEGLIGLSQVAPGVLQGTIFHGVESYDQIGDNVSSAGDVDGDGYEDFLFTNRVSSSSYPPGVDQGKTYLIYGNADGWQTEVDINGNTTLQVRGAVIYSQTVGLESGEYVSSAGDVNNDGYDDILIRSSFTYGSSYYHMTTYSKTYLIYGKAGGVVGDVSLGNLSASGLHWAVFEDGGTNNNAGQRVATVGDVNGDGYDDFLIGAYDISDSDTWSPEAGKTYLVYGKASYYSGEYQLESIVGGSLNGAIFNGISSYDQAGYSVAAAGDVNGDGFMDLLINSLGGADVNYAGESYLIYGSQNGLHGNLELYKLRVGDLPGAIFTGVHSWDNAGLSLASAGDVNGDGLADLILGASGADPYSGAEGQVYLIYGSRTLLNGPISLQDVLDGAIPGAVFNGTQPNDQVGKAVASAGDVNGDGYDDLLIGASSADALGPNSFGMTYLVYGKAVGLSGVFNLSEIQSGDLDGAIFAGNGSGHSVASAGDVNQDGLDDMLIGTPYADTNADNAGSVYLIYGQYAYGINTASITGTVWDDADQNGIRSEDESTLAGISVSLVNVHGYAIKTTTTDAQGNYDFDHVAAGDYQVAINVTDGRIGTQIHQGADDTVDSDVQSVSVTTPLFTLEHAQTVTSLDAGLTVAGSISGVITDDYNEDGMPNPDEPTIAGVTVYLDTNGNDSLDWTDINGNAIWDSGEGERWTQSNEQGEYLFDRLLAGSYAVRQIVPQGYVQTGPEPGSSSTLTQRVSLSETGDQVNGSSTQVDMSADGRYVVFTSFSSKLVDGDTNSTSDVFLVDTVTDSIQRISVSSDGQQGNAYSNSASISDDGRYVVYRSAASNLVDDDTNGYVDIFVYDRLTGQTKRINTLPDGTQANRSSDDPVISGDGRYIAFESSASNLASGTSLSVNEIYIFDQETGALTFMDIALDDTQKNRGYNDPSISADGRYVTFWSTKSNLVADDTNEIPDVFVHDRQTGQTRLVSLSNEGVQANNAGYDPVISPDGRYVAFYSSANNLVTDDTGYTADIFVYDLQSDQIKRITVNAQGDQANRSSYSPTFSADGRYVAFHTQATNLLYGQSTQSSAGIVVYDQLTGDYTYASQSNDGQQANDYAYDPAISADGSIIVYHTTASNLVDGDTNDSSDIFMTRWAIGERLVSLDLGQNVTDINWANAKNGSIGDRVWLDLNRDGVQDASEVGVANVTVNLLDDQQNVIETTITNEQGDYLFSHLAAGDYIVQFVLEDGHTFTSTQGSNDETDSDADAITGLTDVLTLQANQHVDNIDAGIVSSGS